MYDSFWGLISKYSCEFTLITKAEGSYNDAGEWQDGAKTEVIQKGAIIGFSETKMYQSDGTITAQDKHLFMAEPIDGALSGAEVAYNGNRYKIEEEKGKDNAVFTGVYTYVLRWVSAFD